MTLLESHPSRAWRRPLVVVGPAMFVVGLLSAACGTDETPVVLGRTPPDGGSSAFDPGKGGRADSGAAAMCPTAECPPGRATCPDSQFPCDVDLQGSDLNCGACGNYCATYPGHHGKAVCVDGTCTLRCLSQGPGDNNVDCNALIEDGCEIDISSDSDNCGACGTRCGANERCEKSKCVCAIEESCGACGTLCPPSSEPPFPAEWNATYGCRGGQCNEPLCVSGYGDCNGDLPLPAGDGCETPTSGDPLNCGSCGHACALGEICFAGECKCECGGACFKKLDRDPYNCGTCGVFCGNLALPGVDAICNQGICEYPCLADRADCDHLPGTGCETRILEDPANCGGCGIVCDGVEDQACVDGKCTVKECLVQ